MKAKIKTRVGLLCTAVACGCLVLYFVSLQSQKHQHDILANDLPGFVEMAATLSARKSPVLFTLINDGYIPLLLSWLCNTASMGIHDQVLLVVLGEKTQKKIQELWPNISIVTLDRKETMGGNQVYSTAGYIRIIIVRIKLISILVESRIPLLIFDSDFVWIRNPLNFLDLFTEYDMVGAPENLDGTRNLNMGFLRIYPTDRSVKLLKMLADMMVKLGEQVDMKKSRHGISATDDDQTYLNNLINQHYAGIRAALLPRWKFPVGQWYDLNVENRKRYRPLIIHNNFIIGNERKIARAKNFSHWFIFEDGRCNHELVSKVTDLTTTVS